MKRIFTTFLFLLSFTLISKSQSVQASIGIGSAPNRIKIYIKYPSTVTSNFSTLEFNIAVPESESVAKPVVVSSTNSIPWDISDVVTEGGYNNFAITTGTSPISNFNLQANVEFEVMELEFSDNSVLPDSLSLVTLPDGGSTGFQLFYCTGSPQSDGSNLYYGRNVSGESYITNFDNEFSYDITGNTSGTTTSTATLVARTTPVTLSSFNATLKNNSAILSWSVENQDANSSHFEIERSLNGTDFNQVGTVQASSASQGNYSYADNASTLFGTVYYRLKMVDKNGAFVYSDIKSVQFKNAAFAVTLYPNPVHDVAKLNVTLDESQMIKVFVSDAMGKSVQQFEMNGQKGFNEKTLNLSNVPTGSYMVRIQAGANSKTISLIKN
ncbi:MAG: T9SS type A sorting domain-containing protein [Ginsengibacter sp.]